MNELIFQPIFDENNKINGHIILSNMFGLDGLVFCFQETGIPRNWRDEISENVFDELISLVNGDIKAFQFDWYDMFRKSNLYVYSHTPTKLGGYIRVLTEPDNSEDGSLRIEEQEHYPSEVSKAGPVEKFLFDYADDFTLWLCMSEMMPKCSEEEDFFWHFGDDLQLDPDIHRLYFNDTVEWNELYWNLYNAIGRPWKCFNYMEAWRNEGNETKKKLTAETDAQRLLFWCMENDYTLDDLYQMVSEKRILTKHFLGPWQESILQYAI